MKILILIEYLDVEIWRIFGLENRISQFRWLELETKMVMVNIKIGAKNKYFIKESPMKDQSILYNQEISPLPYLQVRIIMMILLNSQMQTTDLIYKNPNWVLNEFFFLFLFFLIFFNWIKIIFGGMKKTLHF